MKTEPQKDPLTQKQEIAKRWRGPRARCAVEGCTHTGDGLGSQHADTFQGGHGACTVPGCGCVQFAWGGWLDEFKAALDGANN